MLLKSIRAQNYKSLKDTGIIKFNSPDKLNNSSGLTVLVGENNSGKSAFLGLPYLLRDSYQINDEDRYESNDIKLEFMFDDLNKSIIENIDGGSRLGNSGNITDDNFFEVLKSNRLWNSKVNNPNTNDDVYHSQKDFQRYILDSNFASILSSIQDNPEKKKDFDKLISKLIPKFKSWTTGRTQNNSYIKYRIDNSTELSINEAFGDGILNLFKIVYSLISDKIIFIDEPEAFLHPQAQISLSKILDEISKTKQIIISTHSPFILKSLDYRFVKILHFKLKDKESKIKEIKFSNTDYIPFAKVSYDVYGTNAEEYFESLYFKVYLLSKTRSHTNFSKWLSKKLKILENKNNTASNTPSTSKVCIPVFIRNCIHYPNIRENQNFDNDLKKSISLLESIK